MSESEGERRPRPIGAADENEEDSDNDRNDPKPAGTEAADAAAQQLAPEETTKKAKSTRRPAFSENDLVKEKGLLQIYERFPEKCKYKGKGREVSKIRISKPTTELVAPNHNDSREASVVYEYLVLVVRYLCHAYLNLCSSRLLITHSGTCAITSWNHPQFVSMQCVLVRT